MNTQVVIISFLGEHDAEGFYFLLTHGGRGRAFKDETGKTLYAVGDEQLELLKEGGYKMGTHYEIIPKTDL